MWESLDALYIHIFSACDMFYAVICWRHIDAAVIDLIHTTDIFLTVEVENYPEDSHETDRSYWQKLERKLVEPQ